MPRPRKNQMFVARHINDVDSTSEDMYGALNEQKPDGHESGTVTHDRPGRVIMYKPTPFGWLARSIPVNNIEVNLKNGWSDVCGDCGGECGSYDIEGRILANNCPKNSRAYRQCPVCAKKVYDRPLGKSVKADGNDPRLISDNSDLDFSSPETRTRAMLNDHLMGYHPSEARSMGLNPEAMRQPAAGGPIAITNPDRGT